MFQSQRAAYRLQEKLNRLNSDEYSDISRLEDIFNELSSGSPKEYNENFIKFRARVIKINKQYNRRRNRAIWWSMYTTDLFAFGGVVAVIGLCVYFFLM